MLSLSQISIIKSEKIPNENLIDRKDKEFFEDVKFLRKFKVSTEDIFKFYMMKNKTPIEEIKVVVEQFFKMKFLAILSDDLKILTSISTASEFVQKMVKSRCFLISSSDENCKTAFKIGSLVIKIEIFQKERYIQFSTRGKIEPYIKDLFSDIFTSHWTKYILSKCNGDGNRLFQFEIDKNKITDFFDFLSKCERVSWY